MRDMVSRIGNRWRQSTLYRVFNARDELGRGRLCMLFSTILSGVATNLSSGLFYTGFLLSYGIDIVDIAIITFIPSLTSLLNIFSPWILEHFKKRKRILAIGKLGYYTVNLLGITLLPTLITDPDARLAGFIAIVVVSNSINALFSSGYSAWHANFLPDDIRMDYFSASSCINSFITYLAVLGASILTDSLKGTPEQLVVITSLRLVAFVLAMIDCIVLLLPKEYPYPKTAELKLSNIFTLPVKNRRFLLTVLICASHSFASALPNATISAYVITILADTGVQFTLPSAIDSTYFLFFILLTPFWKKFLAKRYWFRAFAHVLLLDSLTYFAYSFVTAKVVWLYVAVRFSQHVLGVVVNPIYSSLSYVNLPETDRTNYLAFNTIVISLASFSGMMLGTLFTKYMDGGTRILDILGYAFSSTQCLLFACGVMRVVTAVLSLSLRKKVTPPEVLVRKA